MKANSTQLTDLQIFQNLFENNLDPRHPLLKLGDKIPWNHFEKEFGATYCDTKGRPHLPIRLMIGLLMLQHQHHLSDNQVVLQWRENPYWQAFCGYDCLQWNLPANSSSLVRFRKRIGVSGCQNIFDSLIKLALDVGFVEEKELDRVIVDTTVMEKNITHPTDSKLMERSISRLRSLSNQYEVQLKQSYKYVSKKAMRKSSRYAHAKQYQRMKKSNKQLKTYLGRLVRDIERKLETREVPGCFKRELDQANQLLAQTKESKKKLYSLHEPDTQCISKGKAHKRYEFGKKVSIAVTHKKGLSVGMLAHEGNPYDGHTLKGVLDRVRESTTHPIKQIFVDRGYRGHDETEAQVFISGQKRGMSPSLKKALKRRSAIEAHIGHMKAEGKLGRNLLKGAIGDAMNAILCGVGHNLRLLMAWILFVFYYLMHLSNQISH